MQRYVLRADDGPFPDDRGAAGAGAETSGSVTLVLPETLGEYEQARAEVEGVGGNAGSKPAQPAEDGGHGMDAASGAASSEQRRAWGLPDLGDVAAGPARTCEELQRAWSRDAVPLVDARDAIPLLAGDDADRRGSHRRHRWW